jgi:hypothetical protein
MDKMTLPTRTERRVDEVRGVVKDVQIEDRPYVLLKDEFNEIRGVREDVKQPLTDMEILMAGGLEVFFTSSGQRVHCNWPWRGEDQRVRAAKLAKPVSFADKEKPEPKATKKKVAKKKTSKKKASKKK